MFTPKLHLSYSYMAFPQTCVWTAAGWWQYTYNLTTCNSTFINRFPHLLPYHGPEEHDHLGEEFLNYQTMPTTSLQDETEMESFWAGMATRKHKVYIFFVFLFGRCGLATYVAFIDACIYCVIHDANYACCIWTLLQCTYSINQNKIWYVFPFCSLFILNRWQEPKNLRGLLPSPSWSWCCPIRMQMLRGCFQLWDWTKLRPEIAWHWMAPCLQ